MAWHLPLSAIVLSLLVSACGQSDADGGSEQSQTANAVSQDCGADAEFAAATAHTQGAAMKGALMASFKAVQENDLDGFMAIAATPYIQHSPDLPDGWKPVWDLLKDRPTSFSNKQMEWLGDKGFLDNGNYLVMFRQVDRGDGTGLSKIVDVMRFDADRKYAEHWDIRQPLAAENSSGTSETEAAQRFLDTPVSYDLDTEEANKAVAVNFLNTAFNDGERDAAFEKFVDTGFVQHTPQANDDSAPKRCYNIQRVVAQNDIVVVHSKVTTATGVDAIVDIMRVRDGKLVEHWDVVQPVPEATEMPHKNGMF